MTEPQLDSEPIEAPPDRLVPEPARPRHWGPGTMSAPRPVATFNAQNVGAIADVASGGNGRLLPLLIDSSDLATALNDVANDLLLSLSAYAIPSEAEKWAEELDRAAVNFIKAIGTPSVRTAMRLGLDPQEIHETVVGARKVRSAAMGLRHEAPWQSQRRPPNGRSVKAPGWRV